MISGLEGTAAYLDDILITGKTEEEHNERVVALFQRIQDYGFRVNGEKCSFLKQELKYLGMILNQEGRKPDQEKIAAIVRMPAPKDVSELRAFLGMINFYGAFIPTMRKIRAALDALLKKDTTFRWSPECQDSWRKLKEILTSDLLLTHFRPGLPLVVAADASMHGIGAVLTHRFSDGTEKAIMHASKALTPTQQKYAQIEKEGLALIFAVRKFHRFIFGRQFTLLTDHKPLLAIFGKKSGVPVYSAARLQRWATLLLGYDFRIEYRKTTEFGQADALSRLIAHHEADREPEEMVIASIETEADDVFTDQVTFLPVTAKEVAAHTNSDSELQQVVGYVQNGRWPDKLRQFQTSWHYANRRNSLSVNQGCLTSGERICIPRALQKRVLKSLHRGHPGATRMKRLARSHVYWPNMDRDIETQVKNCIRCEETAQDPAKQQLHTWPPPTRPWTRIHADFAGPVGNISYLIIVDAFSKWPEIITMKHTRGSDTIEKFEEVFSRYGNAELLVTDNGPQFTSQAFRNFCRLRGITQMHSAPYDPQSNGQAERFVSTLKRALAKTKTGEKPQEVLDTFLMAYRSSPCDAAPGGKSPAELFLGRSMRNELDLLRPQVLPLEGNRNEKMESQYNRQHGAQ